jgi:fido (protein-threonine AMPylation protein)
MVLPPGCPPWEYEQHPRRSQLGKETAALLKALRLGSIDTQSSAKDTRSIHGRLFRSLTPAGVEYYAGHYRGEAFACLKTYEVQVQSDPRVGAPAANVAGSMAQLAAAVDRGLIALDSGRVLPNAQVPPSEKLLNAVAVACQLFVHFLTVHPYANGNGHAARFCIWAVLGRYGYWPIRWSIEPRPSDPPYSECIVRYRSGDREPLERFVLGSF